MITITDKQACSGCSACASCCPQKAITMRQDEEGFAYPYVDVQVCVDCGLCDNICPFQKETGADAVLSAYALKHRDKQTLQNSTSGGAFTALSDLILQEGGVVYGAAFDENLVVRHIRAVNVVDRNRMRGSKYVQSDIGTCFSDVKQDLHSGKQVLFTGTPCQVAGLKAYLRGKTEGLICCDLICHGVPSPKVLKDHFSLLSQKKKSKLTGYAFRPKKWGWHVHREIAEFENGVQYHSRAYSDLWRNLYYRGLCKRPSCAECPYTNLRRQGDLTIGDCRGIDKIDPDFGSFEGVSLVLINTPIGQNTFEKIRSTVIAKEINVQDVLQPPLRQTTGKAGGRDAFWRVYSKEGYRAAIQHSFGKNYALKYQVRKWLDILKK